MWVKLEKIGSRGNRSIIEQEKEGYEQHWKKTDERYQR